jgi:hypothetical protein
MHVADTLKILVSVEPSQAVGVANALRRAGVTVDEVLEEIGVISATCAESSIAAVSAVPGVLKVERQRTIKLPPPNSPIQ